MKNLIRMTTGLILLSSIFPITGNQKALAGFGKKLKLPKPLQTINHHPPRTASGFGRHTWQIKKNNYFLEMKENPVSAPSTLTCKTPIKKGDYVDKFRRCVAEESLLGNGVRLSVIDEAIGDDLDSLKSFNELKKEGILYKDYP